MLKQINRLIDGNIAIGFLAGTFFWIVGVGWIASYSPTEPQKNACYQASAKAGRSTDECKTFWEKTTSEPIALFTLVLAISTGGLWVATIGLYAGAERQLRHAEGTAIRELRAYVYLDVWARIYPTPPEKPNRWAISLSVINNGKTWARNVRIRKYKSVNPTGDPFDIATLIASEEAPILLGPGEQIDIQFGDIPLTELADLTAHKSEIHYVAWVLYEDSLSDPSVIRQTQLSRHLGADTEGLGHVSFSWNETHNCADEDCPA